MITVTAYVASDYVEYKFKDTDHSFTALVFMLSTMKIDFEVYFPKGDVEIEDS